MEESSTRPTLLRVGTFNVHQWTDRNCENTFEEISQLLCTANLDIIGLQEASKPLLLNLLSKLGDQYKLAANFGGTAVLTRLPVEATAKLTGRCSYCRLIIPDDSTREQQSIGIVIVHLNHIKEEKRIKEVRTIVESLGKQGLPLPDFWMGDFNALTRSDYTNEEWDDILRVRLQNHWELPVSDLSLVMTRRAKSRHPPWKGLALQDACASVDHSERSGPLGTSRFGTRIDYIYFNQERVADAGWKILGCEHIDSMKMSDHNLVVATFERNKE